MLDRAEFSIGDRVSYWNGETFFKATVNALHLNPIDMVVEYQLFYKPSGSSAGYMKVMARPQQIKQSSYFAGGKNDSDKHDG